MVAETLDPKPCTLKVLTCVGSMDGVDVCDMCWLNAPETLTRAVSAASDGDGSMEMVPAGGKGRPSFPWPPHDGEERKLRFDLGPATSVLRSHKANYNDALKSFGPRHREWRGRRMQMRESQARR